MEYDKLLPKLRLDTLNPKQRMFVAAFLGDPVAAARTVLPNGTNSQVHGLSFRMMQHPVVRENIQIIREQLTETLIADSHEVLLYWSDTMRDKTLDRSQRTKCSELLGKFHGLLNDKLIVDNRKVVLNLTAELGQLLPHELEMAQKAIEADSEDFVDADYAETQAEAIDDLELI